PLGVADQVVALLDARKLGLGVQMGSHQAEFSHPASNVQNPGSRFTQKAASQLDDVYGRPVATGVYLNRKRIQLVELIVTTQVISGFIQGIIRHGEINFGIWSLQK